MGRPLAADLTAQQGISLLILTEQEDDRSMSAEAEWTRTQPAVLYGAVGWIQTITVRIFDRVYAV